MTLPQNIFNIIYPIGTIYITKGESPQSIFNALGIESTWQKIEGRFILGSSSSYDVGSVGGKETHTISVDELPSHNHSINLTTSAAGAHQHQLGTPRAKRGINNIYPISHEGNGYSIALNGGTADRAWSTTSNISKIEQEAGNHTHTVSGNTGFEGLGRSYNNMPPYHVCDIYERIS